MVWELGVMLEVKVDSFIIHGSSVLSNTILT